MNQNTCPRCQWLKSECECSDWPPLNLEVHKHLIALGYTHEYFPEDWEDTGGPEYGPRLEGHPAYDQYTSDKDYIIIDHHGHFAHFELRDLEFEKWVEQQEEIGRL